MFARLSVAGVVLGLVAPCAAQIVQGPVFNPVNGSRYLVYQAPTWGAARTFAHSIGAEIATVNNAEENAWIAANLSDGGDRKLFIGLNDASVEGVFEWADGSTATYRNWLPGQPGSPDYVIMQRSGGWDAVVDDYTPFSVIEVTGPVRVPGDYPNIQAAINGVQAGSEILVAPGTYLQRLNFGGKSVVVRGAAGAELTILDGGGAGPVVAFASGEPASTVLEGFTIRNGSATVAGAISIAGGARPTIRECVVRQCQSTNGNIFVNSGGLRMENCRVTANFATIGAGLSVYGATSSANLVNCLIDNNGGTSTSGILLNGGARLDARNCTIVNNESAMIAVIAGSSITIHNSVLWSESPIWLEQGSTGTITYSDVLGGFPGAGNVSAEPRFMGAGDYRLAMDSPCIDAGNVVQYAGHGGMSDLAGEGRAVDEPSVVNTGVGRPPIDMGAYEFQALKGCPSDFNRDGVVNSQDFFEFLASFFGGC